MTVIKRYIYGTWQNVVVGRQSDPGEFLNTFFGEWSDGNYDAGTVVSHLGF